MDEAHVTSADDKIVLFEGDIEISINEIRKYYDIDQTSLNELRSDVSPCSGTALIQAAVLYSDDVSMQKYHMRSAISLMLHREEISSQHRMNGNHKLVWNLFNAQQRPIIIIIIIIIIIVTHTIKDVEKSKYIN